MNNNTDRGTDMKTTDIESTIATLEYLGCEVEVKEKSGFFPSTTYSYRKEINSKGGIYRGQTRGSITVRRKGGYNKRRSVTVNHENWYADGHETIHDIDWVCGFSDCGSIDCLSL